MENATKALLMAAGVLIGVLIISLGVTLYVSLGTYVDKTQQDIDISALQKFNTQFTKYINTSSSGVIEFELTIQDVISAANTAYESNKYYEVTSPNDSNYYVTINLNGTSIESDINEKSSDILSNNIGKQYKCTNSNVKTNSKTQRVYEVNFFEYTKNKKTKNIEK